MPAAKKAAQRRRPRLDAYDRLINRFYEPLVLLRALGKTRGQHTTIAEASGDQQQARRQLLDNLAYLCDYDKGGPTTAAVALEEQNDCYVFWVASNDPRIQETVLPFLRSVVDDLHRLTHESNEEHQRRFAQRCVAFSERRVRKEMGILRHLVQDYNNHLQEVPSEMDRRISRWLNGFVGLDVVDLCYHAYDQRKAPELKEITRRGRLTDSGSNQINGICTSLRHYLGRLSHHIRASKQVIEDGRRLSVLFDPGASRVEAIPVVNSVSRPMADGLTQPLSMLNRMIRQENPLRGHYEEALESMDRQFGLGVRISEQYQSKTFRPLVHAEVQVLEYFHFGKRAFVEKDRYIGTSKPACYCCYLYFRSHPLKCATSRSHQNIWLNWGPPLLAEGAADERYLHQRNILNSMLETIRDDALDQISQKAAAPLSHLDSTTGITPSVLSIQGASRNDDFHWIDNQLGNLSIAGTEDGNGEDGDETEFSDNTPTVIDSDSSTSGPEDDMGSDEDDDEGGGASL